MWKLKQLWNQRFKSKIHREYAPVTGEPFRCCHFLFSIIERVLTRRSIDSFGSHRALWQLRNFVAISHGAERLAISRMWNRKLCVEHNYEIIIVIILMDLSVGNFLTFNASLSVIGERDFHSFYDVIWWQLNPPLSAIVPADHLERWLLFAVIILQFTFPIWSTTRA